MKHLATLSAATLIALSLTACGSGDDQDAMSGTADSGSAMNDSGTTSSDMGTNSDSMSGSDMSGDSMSGGGMNSDQAMSGSGMSGDTTMASEDAPEAAIAVLQGTEGNEDITATVQFVPENGGLAYTTEAQNLPSGEHGYHLHLYGDCSAPDGTSAGTHFNLEGSSKNPPEDIDRITGDLGNISGGSSSTHEGMLDNAQLTGQKAIIGRAVIIHAEPNDPSQPPIGAAGARLACGVIGIANPESIEGMSSSNSSNSSNSSGSTSGSTGSAGSSTGSNTSGDSSMQSGASNSGSQSGSDSEQRSGSM